MNVTLARKQPRNYIRRKGIEFSASRSSKYYIKLQENILRCKRFWQSQSTEYSGKTRRSSYSYPILTISESHYALKENRFKHNWTPGTESRDIAGRLNGLTLLFFLLNKTSLKNILATGTVFTLWFLYMIVVLIALYPKTYRNCLSWL